MIFRSRLCTLSMVLLVQTTRHTSGGNVKNGITWSQARCQAAVAVGWRWPQALRSNSSNAFLNAIDTAWTASALIGPVTGFKAQAITRLPGPVWPPQRRSSSSVLVWPESNNPSPAGSADCPNHALVDHAERPVAPVVKA